MLDTVLRFWQQRARQPQTPHDEPAAFGTPARRTEPAAPSSRPAQSDVACTSIDVGNYA
jgi:hypothetical protein